MRRTLIGPAPALVGAVLALLAGGLGLSASAAGAGSVSAAPRTATTTTPTPTLTTCAADLYGTATRARAVNQAAPAALAAEFSVFRRTASVTDAYRSSVSLATLLGGNDVVSYDARGVRVLDTDAEGDDVYLVAVTLRAAAVPPGCARLAGFRGYASALALAQEATGSGPGVCVVPTVLTVAAGVACESVGALHRYYGVLGLPAQLGPEEVVVVPDAAAELTVGYLHGAHASRPASGDLVRAPLDDTAVSGPVRQSESVLNRDVPTSVEEIGAAGAPLARYPRPPGALGLYVRANDFSVKLSAELQIGFTGP